MGQRIEAGSWVWRFSKKRSRAGRQDLCSVSCRDPGHSMGERARQHTEAAENWKGRIKENEIMPPAAVGMVCVWGGGQRLGAAG